MKCQTCDNAATLHITNALPGGGVEERHLCETCAHRYLSDPVQDIDLSKWHQPPTPKPSEAICAESAVTGMQESPAIPQGAALLEVRRIIISEIHEQQVILLREVGGRRSFSIMIGIFEATGIDRALKGLTAPRPLTHDAWLSTVLAVGATLESVGIMELRDSMYYASLRLRLGDQLVEVDLRPSDAVLMAMKGNAPIFATEAVMREVCGE